MHDGWQLKSGTRPVGECSVLPGSAYAPFEPLYLCGDGLVYREDGRDPKTHTIFVMPLSREKYPGLYEHFDRCRDAHYV